jgi:cytochrome c-type biogenesis protein CcmH
VTEADPKLVFVALASVMVTVAAFALYAWLSHPEVLGGSREGWLGPSAADAAPAPASPAEVAYAELTSHLQRRPNDARALVLKARLDMQAQRFDAAAVAFQKALAGRSKVPLDAGVWVEYAEARGMLQGGRLAGEPLQLVEKALSIDSTNPRALDLAGSAAWEQGDFATASRYWRQLLAQIAPDSTRHVELSAAIARADQRARFALPPARP